MKYYITNRIVTGFLTMLVTIGYAQNLAPLNGIENFGVTDEITSVSRTIRIYNPQTYPIEISGLEGFDLYGSMPFTFSDTSLYVLPGDTVNMSIDFLPQHNVSHSIPLIVRTTTGFGHIVVRLEGQGQYSMNYYQGTENKEGNALRAALNSRISSGYTSLGYTSARDNMYASIDNVNGDVECVYTGRTATFNTRAGANANSFNCEHTFPQGFFNQNEPMRSDIHHLFPTDVSANSQRGNDPFGTVGNPSWSVGGSKSGGGKFEPRDIHKGAAARAMMYFVLRYQDYNNFFQGHQSTLYSWHTSFPPTSAEKQRNDDIASLQNNRNPFVDYPQFMDRMNSLVGSADLAYYDFYYSDDTISLARGNTGLSTYSFLVYNKGKLPVSLFNWQLSDPGLSFSPFFTDTLKLMPDDLIEVQINFDAGASYQNELLSFSNDAGGINNFQIPINSDADFSASETSQDQLGVFPNPACRSISISGLESNDDKRVRLADALGRVYTLNRIHTNQYDISKVPAGLYILQVEGWSEIIKLVVKH